MDRGGKIGDVLLEIQDVSLSFGGVAALSGVSLEVRSGELRAIIGPNGAGKSSLLNVINGVYHPRRGSVTFQGVRRWRMEPHAAASQGIARTFQNIALFKGMTALDNIMTGRYLKMRSSLLEQAFYWGRAQREEIRHRRKVEEIIDFLQIEAIRKIPVGRLPYGLQKRVELARALASEPVLLLLDEPDGGHERRGETGHVPFHSRCQREFGTTIVLIEHDMAVVMELDPDDGELTRTRKVRRGFIAERYAELIEALYSEKESLTIDAQVRFEDGRVGQIRADVKIREAGTFPAGERYS